MKQFVKNSAMLMTLVVIGIACSSSSKGEAEGETVDSVALANFLTADVMAIVDNKCIGCHKPDSKNEDAKEELIWAELPTMKQMHLAKKLYAMQEVLEDGEMPPEKAIKKYPNIKLTDEEVMTLMKWTESLLADM
ncbi:hypothetical protein [Marinoscillum sp. MHG1-6]|uniref:hypothetical protein n=1 Tax=Marinoscillum sp. MHG1-6 TaxID=2959627 RepID=UPI002156F8B4|nr:hypothetical protein [Marinoscillum sp. MHG1-6]